MSRVWNKPIPVELAVVSMTVHVSVVLLDQGCCINIKGGGVGVRGAFAPGR